MMRSLALYNWISANQPGANCEFAHGWWESAEFLQLLSSDFESFDFGVLTSYSMETPPPSSFVTMPVVSALAPHHRAGRAAAQIGKRRRYPRLDRFAIKLEKITRV